MFHSARIKLTAWYLLIIMMVSIAFSAVIYRVLTREVERFARAQRIRIEHRINDDPFAPPNLDFFDPELVSETAHRILIALVMVNASILVLSGGLAYLLAGRTLTPIAAMVDEQNQFISDASHELRTPLTSLKSAMEVNLRDKNLTLSQAKKIMEENITEVNSLQSLSDNLLQLAQYQTPNGHTTFVPVDMAKIIKGAVGKVTPIATEKHITIVTLLKPGTIEANEYSMMDLLVILLDNAIKYSKENSSISIGTVKKDRYWTITVQDHGIGIAPHDLPHIFDRFYRADSARSKSGTNGYGLGLAIAKQITDTHNGTINAASTSQKGTTIQVTIPIKKHFS